MIVLLQIHLGGRGQYISVVELSGPVGSVQCSGSPHFEVLLYIPVTLQFYFVASSQEKKIDEGG